MDVYENMKNHGITLPDPPAKGGLYAPVKLFAGKLAYASGCGPISAVRGKLGAQVSEEEGMQCARECMLNVLAVLQREIGDLNRVKSVAKITCFVASDDSFTRQPAVANGASGLLAEVFGEAVGIPSRSAIGVNVLPGDIPVEVEALFEIE